MGKRRQRNEISGIPQKSTRVGTPNLEYAFSDLCGKLNDLRVKNMPNAEDAESDAESAEGLTFAGFVLLQLSIESFAADIQQP